MWILAINTATDALGVGVAKADSGQVASVSEVLVESDGPSPARGGHSERLLPAIEQVCEEAGIGPADLGGVAVVTGPGGFTGIRTGLAAAKAIAQARGLPIWGVDTLEALAAGYPGEGLVSPMLDARRGEVFAALYRRSGEAGLERLEGPVLVPAGDWLAAHEGAAFVGEGALRHEGAKVGEPPDRHAVRPATIARLAAPHLVAGGTDPVALVPSYHRAPVMAPDWRPGAGMK